MTDFALRNMKKNMQPWEYHEIGKALTYALSKYSKEEIAKTIGVRPEMVTFWKQKIRIPTRERFEKLKNIDNLIGGNNGKKM